MPSELVYAGVGRLEGIADATVIYDYAPALSSCSEDTSIIVSRQAPRENIRVNRDLIHLIPMVEQIVHAMDGSASRPDRDAVQLVTDFLTMHGQSLRPGAVTPTADAGIQLEWLVDGIGVELEFDADGDVVVVVDRNGVVTSDVTRDLTDEVVLSALRFIRRS